MPHRHLTLERYELALEEDRGVAARLRRQAQACPTCAAALAQARLGTRLAIWAPPAAVAGPVDWERALRRAVAPSAPRPERREIRWTRLAVTAGLALCILLATTLPAAAGTGPDSILFPMRGAEEEARWRLTPEPDRAALEADLATEYLWQASTSAARHDGDGYQAAMQRFFIWAERLETDIRKAPPGQRSNTRKTISLALSLVSPLAASHPVQARRAESIIDVVQAQSEEGDGAHGQRGHHTGRHGPGRQGDPSTQAPSPEGADEMGAAGDQ